VSAEAQKRPHARRAQADDAAQRPRDLAWPEIVQVPQVVRPPRDVARQPADPGGAMTEPGALPEQPQGHARERLRVRERALPRIGRAAAAEADQTGESATGALRSRIAGGEHGDEVLERGRAAQSPAGEERRAGAAAGPR